MEDCHNSGLVTLRLIKKGELAKGSYTGGIIGFAYVGDGASLSINSSTNSGNVFLIINKTVDCPFKQAAIGGIGVLHAFESSGTGTSQNLHSTIRDCSNTGDVSITSPDVSFSIFAGGIVACDTDPKSASFNLTLDGCLNSGSVSASANNAPYLAKASGLAMFNMSGQLNIISSMNSGDVISSGTAFGLANVADVVENSVNLGVVNGLIAFGISETANYSARVVSIGNVIGKEHYATYKLQPQLYSTFYGQSDSTASCGQKIFVNDTTKRWVINGTLRDVMNMLNKDVEENKYSRWWTSNLTLGHRLILNGTSLPGSMKEMIVEHGEIIRYVLQREGLQELLNESQYLFIGNLDNPVVSDCVFEVKKVHMLIFSGIANGTIIFVVDSDVPSVQKLEPIQGFINNDNFLIVNEFGKHFNASEPVNRNDNYTVKHAKSLEVIVDGPVSEDDIRDVIDIISDGGNVVIRVIVSDNEDGTTRLVFVVDDDHSDDVYDRLVYCKSL